MESRKYGEAALPPESLLLLFEHDIKEDTLQTPTRYLFPQLAIGKRPSILKSLYLSMNTLQISILNPKAGKLLQDLADLNLISIKELADDNFLKVVMRLRKKAEKAPLSLNEITKEVELVRAKRYAKEKR